MRIDCRIYERAPEIKPLGVCITLLPHAMREFCALGLKPAIWPTSFRFPYEAARVALAAKVVRTNREQSPDFINIKVEELVGDKPFDNLDKYITRYELRALSENYKRIAGFALADVAGR